jgi:transcriptional regulator with XRE-family HTH domain
MSSSIATVKKPNKKTFQGSLMLQEHYPNRLCFFRRQRRFSQRRLAFLTGIKNRSLISHYERGNTEPSFEMAWKFAYIFKVEASDIFPRLASRWQQEVESASQKIRMSLRTKEDS